MRLDEIEPSSAEEARVKRLKDNAASAKERANQLKAHANAEAERLRLTRPHEGSDCRKKAGASAMIKSHE